MSVDIPHGRRVLITGGLGYLGSVLSRELRTHGYDPVVYDVGFFDQCTLSPPDRPAFIRRDARDITAEDVREVDAVVHFAAISNDPFGNLSAQEVYDPTRRYAARLAALCRKIGKKFIFASSCSVYGRGGEALVDEDSPLFPQTPYSVNKMQIEQDLQAIAGDEFRPISFRFATAYGMSPRIRFDVYINMLVGMAVARGNIVLNSDGQAWRPNVHILDICQAVRRGLEHEPPAGGLTLNVGDTADNYRIIEVAKLISAAIPGCRIIFLNAAGTELSAEETELIRDRKVPTGADTRTYRVSFQRILRELPGFKCEWSVQRGIARLVDELRAANLSPDLFADARFYRLQYLQRLHDEGRLTADLRWRAA